MRTLPMAGATLFSVCTKCPTTSAKRLTGTGSFKSEVRSSSRRLLHEAIVTVVSRKHRATCAADQARAAFSCRIAIRSSGG